MLFRSQEVGVVSTLLHPDLILWLQNMFRWFYYKQQNFLGIDEYSSRLEQAYNLGPQLVEFLFNEYYQYFEKHHSFKVNGHAKRLIDRKPDDWELGIVSSVRTEKEIELLLSDQFLSAKKYGEVFTYRFCTDSLIRYYSSAIILHSDEAVSEEIDGYDFKDGSEVYILSSTPYNRHVFSDNIKIIEKE